jgi:hypothetical protein
LLNFVRASYGLLTDLSVRKWRVVYTKEIIKRLEKKL